MAEGNRIEDLIAFQEMDNGSIRVGPKDASADSRLKWIGE